MNISTLRSRSLKAVLKKEHLLVWKIQSFEIYDASSPRTVIHKTVYVKFLHMKGQS
jgi:hypothetical protein